MRGLGNRSKNSIAMLILTLMLVIDIVPLLRYKDVFGEEHEDVEVNIEEVNIQEPKREEYAEGIKGEEENNNLGKGEEEVNIKEEEILTSENVEYKDFMEDIGGTEQERPEFLRSLNAYTSTILSTEEEEYIREDFVITGGVVKGFSAKGKERYKKGTHKLDFPDMPDIVGIEGGAFLGYPFTNIRIAGLHRIEYIGKDAFDPWLGSKGGIADLKARDWSTQKGGSEGKGLLSYSSYTSRFPSTNIYAITYPYQRDDFKVSAKGELEGFSGDGLSKLYMGKTDVIIPRMLNVITISDFAFNKRDIETIDFSGIPNLEKIGSSSFQATKLTNLDLSPLKKLKVIDSYAFNNSYLERVNFTGTTSLEEIGERSFQGNNLQGTLDLRGAKNLKNIGARSFYTLENLEGKPNKITAVRIEGMDKLKTIGEFAFTNHNIESVNFSGMTGLETIGESSFRENNISTVIFGELPNLRLIGNSSFYQNKVKDVDLSLTGVENIDNFAFSHNRTVQTLKLGDKVKRIGENAFQSSVIGELKLPESMEALERRALVSNNLEELEIPQGVTKIGDEAFAYNNLTKVSIPKSVITIGENAYFLNQKISKNLYIYGYRGTQAQTYAMGNNHTFVDVEDKTPPTIDITIDETGWTNGNVEITAIAVAGVNPVKWIIASNGQEFESGGVRTTVKVNGTYTFTAEDVTGNKTTKIVTISNIDREPPEVSIEPNGDSTWKAEHKTKVNVTDKLSGVGDIYYQWATSSKFPTSEENWEITTNGKEIKVNQGEGDIYLHIKALDKAGNESQVTSKVFKIDSKTPNISATLDNTQWTNKPVNIKVTSEESLSGLKGIEMIDSPLEGRNLVLNSHKEVTKNIGSAGAEFITYTDLAPIIDKYGVDVKYSLSHDLKSKDTTKKNLIYSYHQNGSESKYKFKPTFLYDYVTTQYKRYSHGNIDVVLFDESVEKSLLSYYGTYNTGNIPSVKNVKFEVGKRATPYTPAPKDIKLINNSKTYPVIANGLYTFKATYNNGTESETSVNVSNIDLDAPVITITGNPTDYTDEDEITLTIKATDDKSGVDSITLPDGKVVNGTSATYKVDKNDTYTFKVKDKVGNESTQTITVDKIMIPYKFYIYGKDGKPLKGAGYELSRDGKAYATAESDVNGLVDFGKVPPTGKYTIKQIYAPDGYIVDSEEKEVDVDDVTEPEEIISYPRGDELPSTGTIIKYLTLILSLVIVIVLVIINHKKRNITK